MLVAMAVAVMGCCRLYAKREGSTRAKDAFVGASVCANTGLDLKCRVMIVARPAIPKCESQGI